MSKADELSKKMVNTPPIVFTPRQSVEVKPIPKKIDAIEDVPRKESPTETPKAAPKAKKKAPAVELVSLFAKIPKGDKRWIDHYRVDSDKELGEIISDAIQLLKKQVEGNK